MRPDFSNDLQRIHDRFSEHNHVDLRNNIYKSCSHRLDHIRNTMFLAQGHHVLLHLVQVVSRHHREQTTKERGSERSLLHADERTDVQFESSDVQ